MKKLSLAVTFVLGFPLLAFAQSAAPARAAPLDDVVTEVRALRAEVQSGIRAQLLVARLQVQEQRIAGIARDLAETEKQIRSLEEARNPFLEDLLAKMAQDPPKPGEPDLFGGMRAQFEKIQNGDPVLKERQVSLSRLLSEEQARWTAFNAQLEALERELAAVKKR